MSFRSLQVIQIHIFVHPSMPKNSTEIIKDFTYRDFLLFTRELEEKADGGPGKPKVKRKMRERRRTINKEKVK